MVLLQRVPSFDLSKLNSRVLVQELINAHVATADSHSQLALSEAHLHTLGPKLVLAGGLAEEHYLQLVAVRVVVHEVGELDVHGVVLQRDVNADLRLQLHAVELDGLYLLGLVSDLLEQLQADLIGFVDTVLELIHILH